MPEPAVVAFVNYAPVRVGPGGSARMWARDANVDMSILLDNVGDGVWLFRLEPNPNRRGLIRLVTVPVDAWIAHPNFGCDYLGYYLRDGELCPVLFELSKKCPDPSAGKKLEQLYASMAFAEYYFAVYRHTCNGALRVAPPRFVSLSCQGSARYQHRAVHAPFLHSHYPRIVMPAATGPAGTAVYYYGGPNKIIRVAVMVIDNGGVLDSDAIFQALPETDPATGVEARLKELYRTLVAESPAHPRN